jgi:hypothetical protein
MKPSLHTHLPFWHWELSTSHGQWRGISFITLVSLGEHVFSVPFFKKQEQESKMHFASISKSILKESQSSSERHASWIDASPWTLEMLLATIMTSSKVNFRIKPIFKPINFLHARHNTKKMDVANIFRQCFHSPQNLKSKHTFRARK